MELTFKITADTRRTHIAAIIAALYAYDGAMAGQFDAPMTRERLHSILGADTAKLVPTTIAPEDNPAAGMAYDEHGPAAPGHVETRPPSVAQAFAAANTPPPAITPVPGIPQPPATEAQVLQTLATVTTTPAQIAAALAPQLDAKGLPWDARIHSDKKAMNKDGTWRQRRNLGDAGPALIAQVEAEHRDTMANVVPRPPAPAPVAGAVPLPPAPAPGGVPQPPAPNPFGDLCVYITSRLTAGTLTTEKRDNALAQVGIVGGMAVLAGQPQLIPAVREMLERV